MRLPISLCCAFGTLGALAASIEPGRQLEAGSGTSSQGASNCQCISSWDQTTYLSSDGNNLDVPLGGKKYSYPLTYGMSCTAHDTNLAPYCNIASPPEWCEGTWCYVDPNACAYPASKSSYFPGLHYSYTTCGAANTFASWFGSNTAGGGAHKITDIADVAEGYLKSIVNTVEEAHHEAKAMSSCSVKDACACTSCVENAYWGQAIDVQASTLWKRTSTDESLTSDETLTNVDTCLASIVSDAFTKVAAKEANVSNVGYAYYGSQALGNYVQWPGTNWCPKASAFDPRYRPWYAAAASGPKDVVIIIDTSGSMRGDPIDLAKDAAKAVLRTLTSADYVSIITFATKATAYKSTLEQATGANVVTMRKWIDDNVDASGTTNYVDAFSKAWDVLKAGGPTSSCNRVVLFLTDGKPNEWGESNYASVKKQAKDLGDVHVFTYGLGTNLGTGAEIMERIAQESKGIAFLIPKANDLANIMASYYMALSPMLSPCKTRWVSYADAITGDTLLGACLGAHQMLSGSAQTSCNGGLAGLGEVGDPTVSTLIGVACIDLNMLVRLDVIQARADWSTFNARIEAERTACPKLTITEAQLNTLRATIPGAIPPKMSPPATPPGVDPASDLQEEGDGGSVGAIVGIAVGAAAVVVILCACWCAHMQNQRVKLEQLRQTARNEERRAENRRLEAQRAVSTTSAAYAQPPVVHAVAVPMGGEAGPSSGVAMGKPVAGY